MSYSRRQCRTNWTSGQNNRVLATLNNLRPGLSRSTPPTNRLPGQIDDCNGNGVEDGCDIINGTDTDCNGNGRLDSCDLADDYSDDSNANGTPDECERLYVDIDAAGAGNGFSWTDAFTDLQDALALAELNEAGTEIWVAEGTYVPGSTPTGPSDWEARSATFDLPCGVKVYGGFNGTEADFAQRSWTTNETILSGDLAGDDETTGIIENAYRVVDASDTNRGTILDGFTITGGHANHSVFCACNRGAGITMGGAGNPGSLRVANCHIRGNEAFFGGGVYLGGDSFPLFRDCIFEHNGASDSGGAVWSQGNNTPIFLNCAFLGNIANYSGGAILHSNTDTAQTGAGYTDTRRFTAINTIFVGNQANESGGAIRTWSAEPRLINCSLVGNVAGNEGGAINAGCNGCTLGTDLTIENSILWNNEDAGGTDETAQLSMVAGDVGTVSVSYSCVMDANANDASTYPGTGNIDDDPKFLDDPDNGGDAWGDANDNYGDLRLATTTPADDIGDNSALPMDGWDLDGDIDRDESLSLDLIYAVRVQNSVVDMGAYEGTYIDMTPIVINDNGDFESQSIEPWVWNPGGNPGHPTPEFSIEDIDGQSNALHIFRATDFDGSHAVAYQELSVPVAPGAEIGASLRVRIDSHNFGGFNSWNAYPANLWVSYLDEQGGSHSFRRSFYTFASPGHTPDAFPAGRADIRGTVGGALVRSVQPIAAGRGDYTVAGRGRRLELRRGVRRHQA